MNAEAKGPRAAGSCYEKAVDLLARRPHFREELAGKLRRRGYSERAVLQTLDRLSERGYLDDLQCARDFVESRRTRAGMGRRRLVAELERRGASTEVITTCLEPLSEEDDLATAREAARRWLGSGRADRRALARHLDRKGFSSRAILSVLEEHDADPSGSAPPEA